LEVACVEDVVTAGDEYGAHRRKVMGYLLFVIGKEEEVNIEHRSEKGG
jgi:hypothetical protein